MKKRLSAFSWVVFLVLGIVLSLLIFGVILWRYIAVSHPTEVITPAAVSDVRLPDTEDVVIYLTPDCVTCTNYASQVPSDTMFSLSDVDFESEFSVWLQELVKSEIIKNDGSNLIIKADKDVDFVRINGLFELLRQNNLNKFTLMTALRTTD